MLASCDRLHAGYDSANLTGNFWQHIGELQPLVADLKGIRNRHNNMCLEFRIGARARTTEHHSSDFCAVLHFACIKDDPIGFKRKNSAIAVQDFERTDTAKIGDGDIEESVFINVVEFPEEEEQRREYMVRALVRLEPFDFIQHTRSQIAKSAGRGFSKRLRIATDGEIQVSRVGERVLPRSEDGNRVDKMIQCTPEIMNGIAGEKRQSLKSDCLRTLIMNDCSVNSALAFLVNRYDLESRQATIASSKSRICSSALLTFAPTLEKSILLVMASLKQGQ